MNIIELAKQAGLGESYISKTRKESGIVIKNIDCLEAFAALVEAAARADEREECAKMIELHAGIIDTPNAFIGGPSNVAKMIARDLADSIRARGTT